MRTSQSSVSIAGLPSPSALGNKNNLRPEAIPIIPNAVPHAARKGRHGSTATVAIAIEMIAMATGLSAKCFLRYVPSVEKIPRCHSSPVKIDRFIVAIVTIRSDLADHASLLLKAYIDQGLLAYICHSNKNYTI